MVLIFILARYRLVLVVCLLIFASYVVETASQLLRQRKFRELMIGAACLIPAALFVHLPFAEFPQDRGFAHQWYSLAQHYEAEKSYQQAVSAYERAITENWFKGRSFNEERLESHVSLARNLVRLGEFDRAETILDAFLKRMQNEDRAHPRKLIMRARKLLKKIESREELESIEPSARDVEAS